ncbi:hypothetical protein [Mesorhizobium sp.]|uniref:hypothetical protein n=1 Tax=Mesorhizobium sp. TaxID=1871066 RepID=UPI000FE70B02|nr:hypothetical protein [Mesorhizobium sp.]RWO22167.1 MAG: hypothetical protein EOS09_21250 [Mesorhizobium sp.]
MAVPVEVAAANLDVAFRKTHTNRVHLCPLDCADDLPELHFGPNTIRKLSATELEELVDQLRLKRTFSKRSFDAANFSEFTWLVVRETVTIDERVGTRAIPFFYQNWAEDFGAIDPHKSTYPIAMESALAFLMLAPWEEWTESADVEWRCFRIPWIYTIDDDIFSRPANPPSADTLSWQPDIVYDHYGQEIDLGERPSRWDLKEQVTTELPTWVNDQAWSEFSRAQVSPLFSSPVLHFLLRAYRSSEIDEFLANITVIDSALGLHSDHGKGPTARLVARLSSLLDDDAGNDYRRLFNTRSEFVHGRAMEAIPGKDRLRARRLARRATVALVNAAHQVADREGYLDKLWVAVRKGK